jgi:hypothetical protein
MRYILRQRGRCLYPIMSANRDTKTTKTKTGAPRSESSRKLELAIRRRRASLTE